MPPSEYSRSQFEFAKELASRPEELKTRLLEGQCLEMLVDAVGRHLAKLARQTAATAVEMNDKFTASVEDLFSYGTREVYEGGLNEHIGMPNDKDPVEEMWREHCWFAYARDKKLHTRNYGIDTTPEKEFRAAAGRWSPLDRSFEPLEGFEIPEETVNCPQHHRRKVLPLQALLKKPSAVKASLTEPEVLAVRLWTG